MTRTDEEKMKNLLYAGLKAHASSRLEFLTISLRKGSDIDFSTPEMKK